MQDKDSFDKFTKQARKALSFAEVEAQNFQHNYISTEHLLLGLLNEGEGVATKVLVGLGVEPNQVRLAVEFIISRGDRIVLGEIGLTPRAKKAIELAIDEARLLNHSSLGTEHLLLGLVREGEGIAAGVLESLGVNLENARTQTIRVLSQSDMPQEESDTEVSVPPSAKERGREQDMDVWFQEVSDNLGKIAAEQGVGQFSRPQEESGTEVSVPLSAKERGREQDMDVWSQEASDNLEKIAFDAAKAAQKSPGHWVNPLESYLLSRIRYAQTLDEIRQFLAEATLDEEVINEQMRQCTNGFFQIYYPKMDRLYGRRDESDAVSFLKESWYEEIHKIEGERHSEVIHLIKRMGGLETEKIRSIKSRRCFIESSAIPEYQRFISADRRFPISVSYPQQLSFFYDFNDERNLHVDWDGNRGSLGISRENLGMSAQGGNKDAKLVLLGKKDISQFMLEDFAQRHAQALMAGVHHYPRKPWLENKIVGERAQPIEAKRLVWQTPSGQYGGEWVFFMRARQAGIWSYYRTTFEPRALLPELWTIYNSLVDEEVFDMFLSSFQWLSLDFFRSLPA